MSVLTPESILPEGVGETESLDEGIHPESAEADLPPAADVETSARYQHSSLTPAHWEQGEQEIQPEHLSGHSPLPEHEISSDDDSFDQPRLEEPSFSGNETPSKRKRHDSQPEWEKHKERYQNMPLEEKRKQYRCKDRYTVYNEQNFPGASMADSERSDLDKLCVWKGDITTLEFGAIVNAANERMRGGGGVDGAIHAAAGPYLIKESSDLYEEGCPTGEAKITGGYKLPAKYVIHTVGPRNRSEELLRNCYEAVLRLVDDYAVQTVAIPCVSTGVFGYPNEAAAKVALSTVLAWLKWHPKFMGRIVFCVFLDKDEEIYKRLLRQERNPSGHPSGSFPGPEFRSEKDTRPLIGRPMTNFTDRCTQALRLLLWLLLRFITFPCHIIYFLFYHIAIPLFGSLKTAACKMPSGLLRKFIHRAPDNTSVEIPRKKRTRRRHTKR